jgi:hypothetical protein
MTKRNVHWSVEVKLEDRYFAWYGAECSDYSLLLILSLVKQRHPYPIPWHRSRLCMFVFRSSADPQIWVFIGEKKTPMD